MKVQSKPAIKKRRGNQKSPWCCDQAHRGGYSARHVFWSTGCSTKPFTPQVNDDSSESNHGEIDKNGRGTVPDGIKIFGFHSVCDPSGFPQP